MGQEFHSNDENLYQGERKDVVNNNAGVHVAAAAACDGGSQVRENESSGFDPNENANTTQSYTISDSTKQALSVSNLYGKIRHLPSVNLKLGNWKNLADNLETLLTEQSGNQCSTQTNQKSGYHQDTTIPIPIPRIPYFPPPPVPERAKAPVLRVLLLKIGSWERVTIQPGDVVAKCYYGRKKLVWEYMEMSLKRKFEIEWSDIVGIRATVEKKETGILEIELSQPLTFYHEVNSQPRKRISWEVTVDFTGGQALIWRHFAKLLKSDSRLLELSQKPFPTLASPQFQPTNPYGISEFPLGFSGQRPQIDPGLHLSDSHMNPPLSSAQQAPSYQPRMQMEMQQPSFSLNDLSSPDSAEQVGGSHYVENPGMRFSGQAANNFPTNQVPGHLSIASTTPTVPASHHDNDYSVPGNWDVDRLDKILMDCFEKTLMTESALDYFAEESPIPNLASYEALINQANNGQDISAGGDMGLNDTAGLVYQQPVS